MKITVSNAKEYAHNVMDKRQLADYNAWAGTKYETKEELLTQEPAKKIAKFYSS